MTCYDGIDVMERLAGQRSWITPWPMTLLSAERRGKAYARMGTRGDTVGQNRVLRIFRSQIARCANEYRLEEAFWQGAGGGA